MCWWAPNSTSNSSLASARADGVQLALVLLLSIAMARGGVSDYIVTLTVRPQRVCPEIWYSWAPGRRRSTRALSLSLPLLFGPEVHLTLKADGSFFL